MSERKCPICLKWGVFEAICPSCLADAKLGRMVRKAMEPGPIELWVWSDGRCGARFSVDHNPGDSGGSIDEALEKLGAKG